MSFIDLIESDNLVDFSRLFEKIMAEKIADALEECQVYVADRMFEDVADNDPVVRAQKANQDVSDYTHNLPKERQADSTRTRTAHELKQAKIDYKWGKDENGNDYHVLKHESDADKPENWTKVDDERQIRDVAQKMVEDREKKLKGQQAK